MTNEKFESDEQPTPAELLPEDEEDLGDDLDFGEEDDLGLGEDLEDEDIDDEDE